MPNKSKVIKLLQKTFLFARRKQATQTFFKIIFWVNYYYNRLVTGKSPKIPFRRKEQNRFVGIADGNFKSSNIYM